ncbi:hypothetical protein [Hydrogenophaga sp. OTU3427]|uniref:hypothetical protein n=1 Tax=Hydrogenophaga sp. OTU3427 TaxID=3043856 RepID=UPI00313E2867
MRHLLLVLPLLLLGVPASQAQVTVSIGINLPVYPQFQRVPGYPVYYAPDAPTNYFFYDGLYWVFQYDNWYSSSWYNGPWRLVSPHMVPLFVLRVPVRYYRHAPSYFRPWRADAPPRWGEHWGRDWEQRRSGWDRWDHRAVPAPAPLPSYQARYPQSRYPQAFEQQRSIESEHYRYRPREPQFREEREGREVRGRDEIPPRQRPVPSVAAPEPRPQRPQVVVPEQRGHDMARPQHGERERQAQRPEPPGRQREERAERREQQHLGDRGDRGDKGERRRDRGEDRDDERRGHR